jgi:hypothetical protein
LEFSSTWIWNAAVMVVDINFLTFSQCDNLNNEHVGWWLTTLWMARIIRWRRP